jgi:hypothetical protein
MADVSLNFRQSAYALESGDFPICLITIDHPSLTDPVRISTDPTARLVETAADIIYGTTSRGEEYYFFPCTLKLPDDTDEGPGRMRLEFDNVNREYVAIIRSIVGPPTVTVEMVMASALDDVEAQWPEFLMTSIRYDATTVTATMAMETLEREPYPAGAFTPGAFPGLF